MAYSILVPGPGIEPGLQYWKHGVLITGLPENSLVPQRYRDSQIVT